MNTIYRVVFNRTRGVLMVANEITSSVQAKGSKTVVATAVAAALSCGTAFAQEYVDKTVEAENNATLQALVSKTGESLELTGDVFKNNTLNLKQTSGNPTAIGVAVTQGNLTLTKTTFDTNAVQDQTGSANGVYGSAVGVGNGNLKVVDSTLMAIHQQLIAKYRVVPSTNLSVRLIFKVPPLRITMGMQQKKQQPT